MFGIILLNETAECAVFFSERLSPASYLYWKLTRALHSYFRACLLFRPVHLLSLPVPDGLLCSGLFSWLEK